MISRLAAMPSTELRRVYTPPRLEVFGSVAGCTATTGATLGGMDMSDMSFKTGF